MMVEMLTYRECRFAARLLDIIGGAAAVIWGIYVLRPSNTMSTAAYDAMVLSEPVTALVVLTCGMLRLAAVFANGHVPGTTWLRTIAAIPSVMVWCMLTIAFWEATVEDTTAIPVYAMFAIFDLGCCFLSAVEQRLKLEERRAVA